MKYRTLGKTGLKVSELGFGGWGIGGDWWSDSDDAESIRSLELAKELGINFFDSALGYGNGHSEELIGQLVKKEKEKFVVTTKIPPKNYTWPAKPGTPLEEVFPSDWIIECTEKSLKNYGLEQIDLQMFHVWLNEWTDKEEWINAVEKLKREGKIAHFGASISFPYDENETGIEAMDKGLFEVIQIVYNIYEQDPQKDLFVSARKNNVGIVARCPLDEGALTGKIGPGMKFAEGSFLSSYFKDDRLETVQQKAEELNWLIEEGYAENLAEAAIRFSVSDDVVSSSIVGMRKPEHAKANCAAIDKGVLPDSVLDRLKKHHWHHNYWI